MHTVGVRWSGEVDYANTTRLGAELHRVIDAAGAGQVVVDLAGVTFFDCAGIATLVTAHARSLDRSVTLCLSGVPERVSTLLRLTGVQELFQMLPGTPAGLADPPA